MIKKVVTNFNIALDAVLANKVRSFLTALGIIFGVGAVIAMMAIGTGAQQEIIDQIKIVGVNNIVITPVVEQTEEELGTEQEEGVRENKRFSTGLNLQDAQSIKDYVPGIVQMSPEVIIDTHVIQKGIRRSAKLVGVNQNYFTITNFNLEKGNFFTESQISAGEPVCIIGKSIEDKFFSQENPLGKSIKCGNYWLKIIGVLQERLISEEDISDLGIRDFNMDVYTPITTMLIRYKDRAKITEQAINSSSSNDNYHQLDKLVVQMEETEALQPAAQVISKMLKRRHNQIVDFEVTVPELLLKQKQRTNQIFNIVLGAIAGISLLVGGIGIMNIMLASVMERIKEIGLRISLGAKKLDIILQFLMEAIMISISGGLIGVILGFLLASSIARIADIPTIITFFSVVISFGVAATVGLIFGIAPARKAARQDPITSLRHE